MSDQDLWRTTPTFPWREGRNNRVPPEGSMHLVPPQYLPNVMREAEWFGVPPEAVANIIQTESGWNPNTRTGSRDERGIGQFTPETARMLGINPMNNEQAIQGVAGYLSETGPNMDVAPAGYNWGPNREVLRHGTPNWATELPQETQDYMWMTRQGVPGGHPFVDPEPMTGSMPALRAQLDATQPGWREGLGPPMGSVAEPFADVAAYRGGVLSGTPWNAANADPAPPLWMPGLQNASDEAPPEDAILHPYSFRDRFVGDRSGPPMEQWQMGPEGPQPPPPPPLRPYGGPESDLEELFRREGLQGLDEPQPQPPPPPPPPQYDDGTPPWPRNDRLGGTMGDMDEMSSAASGATGASRSRTNRFGDVPYDWQADQPPIDLGEAAGGPGDIRTWGERELGGVSGVAGRVGNWLYDTSADVAGTIAGGMGDLAAGAGGFVRGLAPGGVPIEVPTVGDDFDTRFRSAGAGRGAPLEQQPEVWPQHPEIWPRGGANTAQLVLPEPDTGSIDFPDTMGGGPSMPGADRIRQTGFTRFLDEPVDTPIGPGAQDQDGSIWPNLEEQRAEQRWQRPGTAGLQLPVSPGSEDAQIWPDVTTQTADWRPGGVFGEPPSAILPSDRFTGGQRPDVWPQLQNPDVWPDITELEQSLRPIEPVDRGPRFPSGPSFDPAPSFPPPPIGGEPTFNDRYYGTPDVPYGQFPTGDFPQVSQDTYVRPNRWDGSDVQYPTGPSGVTQADPWGGGITQADPWGGGVTQADTPRWQNLDLDALQAAQIAEAANAPIIYANQPGGFSGAAGLGLPTYGGGGASSFDEAGFGFGGPPEYGATAYGAGSVVRGPNLGEPSGMGNQGGFGYQGVPNSPDYDPAKEAGGGTGYDSPTVTGALHTTIATPPGGLGSRSPPSVGHYGPYGTDLPSASIVYPTYTVNPLGYNSGGNTYTNTANFVPAGFTSSPTGNIYMSGPAPGAGPIVLGFGQTW